MKTIEQERKGNQWKGKERKGEKWNRMKQNGMETKRNGSK